ncbi:periplasmic heavy metal sensor [Rugamonas sp. FT82W]|uniref:Periplasmic heavy metal sensor n=1 Tax=Duganella vulcania TaxID=2692166 RepID=A0A845FYD3_9BURK|nr:periplasmic heavy metal sensor [Duganella vulcania]MYM87523.1 periplasmic heavy metal sensor [Duganella vulcania]
MKTSKNSVHNILLAASLALPLLAAGGAARADDQGGDAGTPPMMRHDGQQGRGHDGPDHGPGGGFHGGMPPFGGPGMGGRPPFAHGVELSEAQEDKVFAIVHAEQPYLREQGKAAAKAHEALRALGRAEQYDDAKAAALAKEAATAMANIALQHVRTEQKLLAVLTPEQRKKQAEGEARRAARP